MNSLTNLNDTKFLLLEDESITNKSTNSLLLRLNNTQLLLNEDKSTLIYPKNAAQSKSINEIVNEDSNNQILKAQNNLLNDISTTNLNIPLNDSNNNHTNINNPHFSLSQSGINFNQNTQK